MRISVSVWRSIVLDEVQETGVAWTVRRDGTSGRIGCLDYNDWTSTTDGWRLRRYRTWSPMAPSVSRLGLSWVEVQPEDPLSKWTQSRVSLRRHAGGEVGACVSFPRYERSLERAARPI